jgi:hypothetical protein
MWILSQKYVAIDYGYTVFYVNTFHLVKFLSVSGEIFVVTDDLITAYNDFELIALE